MSPAAEAAPHAPPAPPPALAVLQMITARWVTGAVTTAARFRLADRVARRPRTSDELAAEAGAHAPSLYRLLRALASLGLFTEDAEGRFGLTPLGEQLRSDVPGTMYGMARFVGTEEHGAAWNALPYAVASGEPAFEHVHGRSAWEYFDENADLNAIFNGAMTSLMSAFRGEIAENLALEGARTVADVGGSAGILMEALLERHPSLHGIVYDRPAVIEQVRGAARGVLRERCEFVAGDFFERVPPADVLVLSRVLHDWSDDDAVRILNSCRAALPPHGRVAVIESVIERGDAPDFGKLLDLEMLVIVTGRERTRAEFERLFARAGLTVTGVVPMRAGGIVEGVPG
ncbi:MAG TPA: methyltransferase [Candidatus Elarobacter sp.]|nr:methyltransferase [Candidatus Elarobacter sp.]